MSPLFRIFHHICHNFRLLSPYTESESYSRVHLVLCKVFKSSLVRTLPEQKLKWVICISFLMGLNIWSLSVLLYFRIHLLQSFIIHAYFNCTPTFPAHKASPSASEHSYSNTHIRCICFWFLQISFLCWDFICILLYFVFFFSSAGESYRESEWFPLSLQQNWNCCNCVHRQTDPQISHLTWLIE